MSTWKPLQMPSTGPPLAACARTDAMTGESAAIAATVFGTPVLGLTTLVISKLLQNPLGRAVSYEYLVTGSWDNPAVTRIGASSAPKEAPKAAPPAAARPQ